ncbi:MAG: hypothetical protein ACO1SV_10150 [Fimbriimonas sp.]
MRFLFAFAISALVPAAWGGQASLAPIAVPTEAKVTLEIDARDDDLLAVVKQFLGVEEPGKGQKAPANAAFPIPAHLGIQMSDITHLLRDIHQVRVVGYNLAGGNSLEFHEAKLRDEGLRRMVFSSTGNQSVLLVMRGDGGGGLGIYHQQGNSVTVVRTDGMLDMQLVGRLGRAMIQGVSHASPAPASTTAPAKPAPKPTAKPAAKPVRKTGKPMKRSIP